MVLPSDQEMKSLQASSQTAPHPLTPTPPHNKTYADIGF